MSNRKVLILQHQHQDHAAYLRTWLEGEGVPFEIRNTQAGDAFPRRIDGWRALAVLGGEMSANDDLPPLHDAQALIRDAMARDVPIVGHCLGGQLMARALGARVVASPAPEIGWHDISVHAVAAADDWFGVQATQRVFQWHYEAFELPAGAVALATSQACGVQAFSIGRSLAMQFHVEVDAIKLAAWATARDAQFMAAQRQHASVQSGPTMLARAQRDLGAQQQLADRIYRRWLRQP